MQMPVMTEAVFMAGFIAPRWTSVKAEMVAAATMAETSIREDFIKHMRDWLHKADRNFVPSHELVSIKHDVVRLTET
jgi:hypothetical protein